MDGRIDVSGSDRIGIETRFLIGTDNPGSPNIEAGLKSLPLVTTFGTTLGYEHDFDRFQISEKTTFDRSLWEPSSLTDDTTSSNADRNFDQYGEVVRGSYDLFPGVRPYVEGDIDTRVYDLPIDRTGVNRDSVGTSVKVGTTVDLSGRLTGTVAVGETERTYKDPTLPTVKGPTLDASLAYAATSLTSLKFVATTLTGELIVPGASGVLTHNIGFELDHDFRRWLTGALKLGYGTDNYVGIDRFDKRYVAGASLIYRMSRSVQVRGEYRHEWLRSTMSEFDYDANIALLTVRVQR